jgi:hypothetical protein
MNSGEKSVHLSMSQAEYLRLSSFLPASLAQIVDGVKPESDGAVVIGVSPAVAEEFRSAFSDRLAKVGFSLNYELTDEGRTLEELIDRFFVLDD